MIVRCRYKGHFTCVDFIHDDNICTDVEINVDYECSDDEAKRFLERGCELTVNRSGSGLVESMDLYVCDASEILEDGMYKEMMVIVRNRNLEELLK